MTEGFDPALYTFVLRVVVVLTQRIGVGVEETHAVQELAMRKCCAGRIRAVRTKLSW